MSKTRGFLTLLVWAAGLSAVAADPFRLSAQLSSLRPLQGEPLELQVRLEAGEVPPTEVWVTSETLLTLKMEGPEGPCRRGLRILGYEVNPGSLWMQPIYFTSQNPAWEKRISLAREFVFQGPGRYTLTLEWQRGPVDPRAQEAIMKEAAERFPQKGVRFQESFAALRGLTFEITTPTGVDAAAYEAFRGDPVNRPDILLTRFPTSTYAGYFLGLGAGFPMILDARPEYVVQTLWREDFLGSHPTASLPRRVSREGKEETGMECVPMGAYLERERSRIDRYLSVHPDHPRREIMELARAYHSLALKDKEAALRSLEWVAKNAPTPKWREQGLGVLNLLKAEQSGP